MTEYWRFFRAETRFLGYGLALTFLSSFGQTFFISLFVPFLLADFALSNGEFGSLYAVATLGSAVLLPWTGKWMDRTTLARFSLGIVALIAGSALVLAGSYHVALLFVGLFGLRLGGPGLASYTSLAAIARHYREGRGKALGISSLGFSLGEAVLPLLGTAVLALVGWRVSWLLVAAISLFAFGPLVRGLVVGSRGGERSSLHVERIGDDARGGSIHPSARSEGSMASRMGGWDASLDTVPSAADPAEADRQWDRREMLGDPRFWYALPASVLPAFWATGIFLYQTNIAADKGWSLTVMASAFTAFALTRILFTLVAGGLVDRFTARRVFPFTLVPLGVGLVFLALFGGIWVPYAFMAMLGITTGMSGNVRAALFAELYGIRHLGAIKALMAAFLAVSTAGSPILVGFVIDGGDGLGGMLWGAVASVGLGTLLAFRTLKA